MRNYCNYCGCEQDFEVYDGNKSAVLWGNSHAVLRENSHAVLLGNSHAELRGNSHAVLRGNSHAALWGNSHAELWENSHAVLWGNSHAVLWENSHAQCRSPYACGILKSITAKCTGRHIGDKPLPPKEYLVNCGIEIKNQYVILYKSVQTDYYSAYIALKVKYEIGKLIEAPDWDKNYPFECGKGLHLSPTPKQASNFHDSGVYLACRVKLSDMASLPAYAEYPDKIRVRACVPLYRVDIEGNKIEVL